MLSLAVFHIFVSTHHQNIDMLVSLTIYCTGYLAVMGNFKMITICELRQSGHGEFTNLSFVLKRTQDVVIIRCCLIGRLTYAM